MQYCVRKHQLLRERFSLQGTHDLAAANVDFLKTAGVSESDQSFQFDSFGAAFNRYRCLEETFLRWKFSRHRVPFNRWLGGVFGTMLEKQSVGFGCWCFFAESSAAITRLPVRDHGIIKNVGGC